MDPVAVCIVGAFLWLIGMVVIMRTFAQPEKKPECTHERNWFERRWLARDGTPMAHFTCQDCGVSQAGHVQANPAKWAGLFRCVDGKLV